MKKTILAVAAVVCCWSASAQFVMTDKGLRSAQDKKLDYYVFDCGDKTQEELFNSIVYYFSSRYNSQRDMLSAQPPGSVTLNGFSRDAVADGRKLLRTLYDVNFNLIVDIKDGRVRVWAPVIRTMSRMVESVPDDEGCHHGHHHDVAYLYVSPNYTGNGVKQPSVGETSIYNKRGKLKRRDAKKSVETYFNDMVNSLHRYIDGGNDW